MTSLRILMLGYIVRRPLGGGTWPTLQYALGLKQLGHEVVFLEDSEDWEACYDPSRHVTDADPTFGLRYATEVFDATGLGDAWAYYDAHKSVWHGPRAGTIDEVCRTADLLINNSGIHPIRPWLEQVPRRVYIDTDPAFEQVRQLTDPFRQKRRAQHNVFFTVGENVPSGDCEVPDDGVPWQATRQPVTLDRWEVSPGSEAGRWTTLMLWESYAAQEYEGRRFGMKSESFGPFMDFPHRVERAGEFELAVGGPNVPRRELRAGGWLVSDPMAPSRDPWTFQEFIRQSKGEFALAKHGYVSSRCGWFSERSAHYLASGRPVITQDTGFAAHLPTGEGLFAFRNADEAATALEEVETNYARHCAAARALAEEYFDARRVLTRLVDLAMSTEIG